MEHGSSETHAQQQRRPIKMEHVIVFTVYVASEAQFLENSPKKSILLYDNCDMLTFYRCFYVGKENPFIFSRAYEHKFVYELLEEFCHSFTTERLFLPLSAFFYHETSQLYCYKPRSKHKVITVK